MKLERLLLATVLATSTGFAFAHGSKPHDKPAAASVEDAEQMAWGIHGAGATPGRTIEVRMSDKMRFSPESIEVNEGDVVRFVVHNDGKLMHEFVLGTQKSNDEHAKLMMRFPNMEHDEPHMAHVQAGAGIVADSIPANEYQETLNKARGILKAIELTEMRCQQ